ncbi:MAG: LysE family translocator [Thiomonas sp.]
MPDIHHFTLFLLSGLLLNMTPGADMLFIVSRSAQQGARAGAMAALGVGAGCLVHVTAAAVGLSALIAARSSEVIWNNKDLCSIRMTPVLQTKWSTTSNTLCVFMLMIL